VQVETKNECVFSYMSHLKIFGCVCQLKNTCSKLFFSYLLLIDDPVSKPVSNWQL